MARDSAETKAVRLITQERVRFLELSATRARAEVRGDTDDYIVRYDSGRYQCPCPMLGDCSHARAVRRFLRAVLPALTPKGADETHANEDDGRGSNPGEQFFGD